MILKVVALDMHERTPMHTCLQLGTLRAFSLCIQYTDLCMQRVGSPINCMDLHAVPMDMHNFKTACKTLEVGRYRAPARDLLVVFILAKRI